MSIHFIRDIELLKKQLYGLSGMVEQAVLKSVHALETRDVELAQEVIDFDDRIDDEEVLIEEECQKILALHQPVAHDLRFVIAVLKLNAELERIGDCAVNIAERTMFIATHDPVEVNVDFGKMGKLAQAMLKESLDALINMDEVMAKRVVIEDDKMDAMNRDVYGEVQHRIKETPQHCEYLIHLLSVARHLERIADHASNIADDVIYLVTGDIVRHKSEDYVGETEEG